MNLEKITEEMFQFLKDTFNVEKDQIMDLENNEELRQKLLDELLWIEVDGFIDDDVDEETRKKGNLAADIITFISYKPEYTEEDNEEERKLLDEEE